jgi:hypothetical protein
MRKNKSLLFFICTFAHLHICTSLPAQQTDSLSLKKSISINYDNDFFSAVDYYFTQGIHIELFFPGLRKNPVSKILVKLPSGNDEGFGISANQQCYTPTSIRHNFIPIGDRPYTGSLFIGCSRYSLNDEKQIRLISNLDLGIMGPNGYGEQIQKGIHRWIGSQTPEGWQYQLANTPVINYSVEIEKEIINKKYIDAQLFSILRVGTYFDDVRGGMNARIGLTNKYFEREHSQTKFRAWIFGRGEIEAVGYNATMQGGFFTTNIYTVPTGDVTRIVFGGSTGIVLSYKKVQLEYTKYFISPEYKNGWAHGWGHCNVTVLF